MASKTTKAIPFIIIIITSGFLAVDVFTEFVITDKHIEVLIMMMGTFGLGGIYKTAITKGFEAYKKIKEK